MLQGLSKKAGTRDSAMQVFVLASLSLIVFSVAIIPINSYDFWWHLKTGQYILDTGGLPQQDPFSYTSPSVPGAHAEWIPIVLKGYWLSQVLYAGIVNTAGFEGIIIFRGLLFLSMALCVIVLIRACTDNRASPVLMLLFALATKVAVEDSDRPQVFMFLLSVLALLVVELAVRKKNNVLLYLNVPLFCLASNMHQGYIVGIGFLLVYLLCSWFEERLKNIRRHLAYSSGLALLATYLNPNHWNIISALLHSLGKESALAATVMEHRSPVVILRYTLSDPGWLAYWTLLILSLPAVVYFFSRRRYAWGILLAGTAGASLWSMRYIFFFVPAGTAFISVFLQETVFRKTGHMRPMELACLAVLSAFLVMNPLHDNQFGLRRVFAERTYPFAAAEFISREKLPQPVFNDIQFGGYLEWKLWPEYKMFIDTRAMIPDIHRHYFSIIHYTDEGRRHLEHYHVASVITPAIDPVSGEIIPLVRGLAGDPAWAVAYADGQAVIFTKKGLTARELPRETVYYEILNEVSYWQQVYPWVREYARTRAEALAGIGRATAK